MRFLWKNSQTKMEPFRGLAVKLKMLMIISPSSRNLKNSSKRNVHLTGAQRTKVESLLRKLKNPMMREKMQRII